MVHVELAAALGGLGDGLGGLTLGADEQHAAAAGDDVAHRLERAVEHRNGLLQVDDVGVVANPEEVPRHLRVPAPGLMAEVHAGLEKLAHGERGQSHGLAFLRLSRRGTWPGTAAGTGATEHLTPPGTRVSI